MFNIGFKQKILLCSMLLMLVSVIVSNAVLFRSYKEDLEHSFISQVDSSLELNKYRLENWLVQNIKSLQRSAEYFQTRRSPKEMVTALELLAETDSVNDVLIAFIDGTGFSAKQGMLDVQKVDPRKLYWFEQVSEKQQIIITLPYFDPLSNAMIVSLAAPVKYGVLTVNIRQEQFANFLVTEVSNSSIHIVQAGSHDLLFSSGGNDLVEQYDHMAGGNGPEVWNYANRTFLVSKAPLSLLDESDYSILLFTDENELFNLLNYARNNTIASVGVCIVLAVVILTLLLNYFYRPIDSLKQMILSLSSGDGDLTQRVQVDSKDDLGEIAHGINVFIESLQNMVIEIASASLTLDEQIRIMSKRADQNVISLESHASKTDQVVTAITELNASAESVRDATSQANSLCDDVAENITTSNDALGITQSHLADFASQFESVGASVSSMDVVMDSVRKVLSDISGIAEQTNLLALNASIEAARAGEQGRGFSVVADEVRALAARTGDSTSQIHSMLVDAKSASDDVADKLGTTEVASNATVRSTTKVVENMNLANGLVSSVSDISREIAAAAVQQTTALHEVSRSVESINTIVGGLVSDGNLAKETMSKIGAQRAKLNQVVERFNY